MFGGGEPSCTESVTAGNDLTVGRCGCAGYTTDSAAFAEPVPIVEVTELRLRRPGEPTPGEAPRLAPVRDLLDEGRRLHDLSEGDGVPWRPPS